jgi:S-formylglutathione hydrolase FrmB
VRRLAILLLVAACSSSSQAPATAPEAKAPPPVAATAKGKVVTEKVTSASLGVTKDVVVYLPAGYDADPAKRWPVYYFLHGLGGNETNWVEGGKLDEVADKAGVQAIIVMPDADNSFYADSVTPMDFDACMDSGAGLFIPNQPHRDTCVRTPAYEQWITKDLIAWTDSTYRTIAAKPARAIVGFSMGGFGALVLSMRHKDLYAAAGSHSGVDALLYKGPFPYEAGKAELFTEVQGSGDMFVKWLTQLFGKDIANWRAHDPAYLVKDLKPGELALYLDCGTEDMFKLDNGARYLHELLEQKKIAHTFFIGPGRHDFSFWTPRLPETFKFLAANVAPAK